MCRRKAVHAICPFRQLSIGQPIFLILVGLLCTAFSQAVATEAHCWPRFHGPKGDNVSTETALLKKWPERGPRLLWTAKPIGQGFAGVTIADGRIYTAGDIGNDLVIFALDMDGRIRWQAKNGAAWTESGPPGARGTPTVDGNRLYHENAHDEVVCLDAMTGRKIWSVNLASQFQGRRDGFGRAESLLIDGDRVICCPGGATAMAALDKKTGQTVWKSPGAGEPAGYASPILADHRGLRIILTMASRSLIGVNADSGELLWRFEHYTPRYVANCVTPVYHDGHVFLSGGYGLGSVLLRIDVKGGKSLIEPAWRSKDLDNRHGGVVLVDDCVYGASNFNNHAKWLCLDWKTGRKMYAEKGIGEGSLTCAGGMLYTMSEHRSLALVKPVSSGYQLVSQFKIPEGGEGPTWAHPVVCGGRLYIRHADRLYAYDVRAMQ
jgi:outer membrane protein assembly factor BamB